MATKQEAVQYTLDAVIAAFKSLQPPNEAVLRAGLRTALEQVWDVAYTESTLAWAAGQKSMRHRASQEVAEHADGLSGEELVKAINDLPIIDLPEPTAKPDGVVFYCLQDPKSGRYLARTTRQLYDVVDPLEAQHWSSEEYAKTGKHGEPHWRSRKLRLMKITGTISEVGMLHPTKWVDGRDRDG